ncbi:MULTISPECIES: cell wall metabolism sensor histidine kinase WalK [unclassified Paenibacillus]|uniref:sensor histidine kinase n=1 Tax=unclassified Paenibacillus TaxID=185978 RepID=UPI000CF91413|nr:MULTISPECIES: HAMP domain-containing sensor histidine kinase [unclassified Paenibacillus]MBJ9992015.1 HAMP domain-containing histidine kinase [Paenibacillus sp. S28]PQP86891.1 two-component sensor histidine kinase [Paenibacillus sp. AR247]
MKLVHQINLAFGIALLLVLSVTAVVIHFVLLDHLIGSQKEDLKAMGAVISAKLRVDSIQTVAAELSTTPALPVKMAETSGVAAIFTDIQGKSMPVTAPNAAMKITEAVKGVSGEQVFKDIVDGTDKRFITSVSVMPQGTLTLLTPVSRVKTIEQALLKRLLIIFGVGGAFMVAFSLFITKKLIRPLMSLQEELIKVKERRFSEVRFVRAGGEIGSVAESVYDMAGELDRFNHVQKQFFQNASHELKTPLMSIAGYAEGIRDGVFEGERIRKGLDIIISESGRLKKLVTEMTLLAKLDSEEDVFRKNAVSLKELVTEASERMNPLLVKKGIRLQIDYTPPSGPFGVVADRDKLLQALLNIMSNAARYAVEQMNVHAKVVEGRIEMTISDDGPGIPDELLPFLFHRFVKGKDGESGLGLAISRAIVERCGGIIAAGNRQEGGAVISMSFPAAPTATGSNTKMPPGNGPGKP